jgi:hypothetical protein
MRRVVVATIGGLMLMSVGAAPTFAQSVPLHEHFIELPSGETVRVGPPVCSRPTTAGAFLRFHQQVHRGQPGFVFDKDGQPIGSFTTELCEQGG